MTIALRTSGASKASAKRSTTENSVGRFCSNASPKSHVSFQKKAGALLVHVWGGGALFRYPDSVASSVVVTAGNVQLSHIEAVVCVEVGRDRTIVEVLMGTATFTRLRTGTSARSGAELIFRAGDRVEVGIRHAFGRWGVGGVCEDAGII